MSKNLSLFCEKFNVPEALQDSIPKILQEEEMIILNQLAHKEEKLSDLTSKLPASAVSLIESLHRRGYLLRKSKGEENYYRSNTLEQIIKRYVNHNPKYQELSEEEKIHIQEWIMGISLEEMRACQKPEYRVIPIGETIEDKRQLVLFHQAAHYLQKSAKITLIDCLCRKTFNNCDKPRDVCLALNEKANFFSERGIGENIDIQRGLEILDLAERNGLVHSINNKEDPEYLCNCCECCCFFVQALKKRGIFTSIGKSGFIASLNTELCNQCGICLDKCIFEAISEDGESIIFDEEKCFGCGLCAYNCPQKAIKLVLKENESG